jgi:ABC-2 type transport system permease protein
MIFSLSHPSRLSHLRALGAIALNDWKHFWRYPLNAVARSLEPLVWIAPLYFMSRVFSVNGQTPGLAAYTGSGDYMSFVLLGTVLINFILSVFWGMGFSLKNDMDTGTLEANWIMPMPRVLLLVGRTINSLITTAITSTIMLTLGALLFGFRPTGSSLAAVLIAIPMLLGLYGFGFAFAALVLVLREANTLVDVSSFVVQTFSGANFPVQALPRWLLPLALAIPTTYGLDAIRGLLLGTRTLLPLAAELGLMLGFMVAMIALGWMTFSALERRVRQRGTLGQH